MLLAPGVSGRALRRGWSKDRRVGRHIAWYRRKRM